MTQPVPLASPRVRRAIDELVVAAEQLQLFVTRAAVVRHPLHPALERLAVGVVEAATRGLRAAYQTVGAEVLRAREAREP